MLLNAFLVAESCIDGMKNRQLTSIDKILAALGISRFCYFCVLLVKIFWMSVTSLPFEVIAVYQTFKALIWLLTCISFCFSSCLCSFYCIKIANFKHHLFLRLKMGISRWVPWMLLGSVFGSLANTYPFYCDIYRIACKNSTYSHAFGNETSEDLILETNIFNLFMYCGTGFSITFFISFVSSSLLLFSLWRHTHLMQSTSTSFSNPSMAAHFRAVKTIMSLLIIDSIHFVSLMLLLSNIFSDRSTTNRLLSTISHACPSMQSQIIIRSNPKLKRAFVKVTDYIRHVLVGKGMIIHATFCRK
ncbi:taste receptor type 2 member 40-like [Eublepharis macularius]|uniref:Taste receptor type 2 n=1 Tax=Eublepharis macularius TaxID=481883 RepID=A0AA97IWA6_EUBMA|nr:taste receptor type 2 member 40-like [Eublepharis macularius]